jgi:hypothetical protein
MSDRWQQIEELYHAAREDRAVLDQADPERYVEMDRANLPLVEPAFALRIQKKHRERAARWAARWD